MVRPFTRSIAPLLFAALLASLGAPAFGAPVARLTLQSEPGDAIGGGQSFDIVYTQATSPDFFSATASRPVGGAPSYVSFLVGSPTAQPNTFAILDFSTEQLQVPLAPGTYPGAQRAAFAATGHPGLDVSFQNRGCNTITGSFTVTEVAMTPGSGGSFVVERFAASFEQLCEGSTGLLRGTFTYDTGTPLLTVARVGTGTGTVLSVPAGISCSPNCAANFFPGTPVTLAPAPAVGSVFTGWGGACSGTGSCQLVAGAALEVTASFTNTTLHRLANLSTRGDVGGGDKLLIAGFVVQGTGPQTVLVRARGPSLAAFGVAGALADPVLQLFAGQALLGSNDDWGTGPDATTIQARGYAPSDAREAALLVTLNPGAYTAVVSGKAGTTGVAIVEVFGQ